MAGTNAEATIGAPGTCLLGLAQVLEEERPHFIRESHILILLELHLQALSLLVCIVASLDVLYNCATILVPSPGTQNQWQ